MFYLLRPRRPPLLAITINNIIQKAIIMKLPTPPKVANCVLRFVFKSSRLFGIYASIPCSCSNLSNFSRALCKLFRASITTSYSRSAALSSSSAADGGGGPADGPRFNRPQGLYWNGHTTNINVLNTNVDRFITILVRIRLYVFIGTCTNSPKT